MEYRPVIRTLALMLAILMILAALAACKGPGSDGLDTDGSPAEETKYPGENGYVLAVNDYRGATCAIYSGMNGSSTDFIAEEETGETLNDSTFRRNLKVENLYNVRFSITEMQSDDQDQQMFSQQVRSIIMSGEDDYQLMEGYAWAVSGITLENEYFHNFLGLPYLDFDQAWWPAEYMKNARIGNNLYMLVGNITYTYYDLFTAILFNKQMAENYRVDDLYETVRDGKWTIDKLIGYAERAVADLDGDGRMDPLTDQYGFTLQRRYPTDSFVTAFEVRLTDTDDRGMPVLLPLTDKYVDVFNKIQAFCYSDTTNFVMTKALYEREEKTFLEGRSLFEGKRMLLVREYRAMENDFGILPYPKWDEKQENYHSFSDVYNTPVFVIPVTTEGTMSANLLEALSYFGYQTILPAYYEKALKGKTARDEQSGEMLDIIYNNVSYDFIQIYGYNLYPGPDLLLGQSLADNRTITYEYNSRKRMYETKMNELIEMLDIDGK